jgi:Cu/Zn superoxide dismutase
MRSAIACFLFLLLCGGSASTLAQVHFTAHLTAAEEVPANASQGVGTASCTLSDDMTELRYRVTVDKLSGPITGAHIHNAAPGAAGPVVTPFTMTGNSVTGVWKRTDAKPFTRAMMVELLLGNLYVNVHTSTNPGGEIRGQLRLDGPLLFSALMDAKQEGGSTSSNAQGTAWLVLDPDYSRARYRLTVAGLSGIITAAHIHQAAAGSNGPPVCEIAASGNTLEGTWTASDAKPLTKDLIKELLLGNLYVNVHTAANPGGEARGQFGVNAALGFTASLDGSQERPVPNNSAGKGTAFFTLNEGRTDLFYAVTVDGMSGAATAAHFHYAVRDSSGPVVFPLTMTEGSAIGTWSNTDTKKPLTAALVLDLLSEELYLNAHTSASPAGEIRGQIAMATGVGFTAMLDGMQQPSPSNSAGTGTASCFLLPDRSALRFDLTVSGLSGAATAAHFHKAASGASGPAVFGIDVSGGNVQGQWSTASAPALTPDDVEAVYSGNYYINVHTAAFPAGEIRGQVLGSSPSILSGIDLPLLAGASGFSVAQQYPNPMREAGVLPFRVPRETQLALVLFDAVGRRVATLAEGRFDAGEHSATIDASALPAGMYVASLSAGGTVLATRMLTLIK